MDADWAATPTEPAPESGRFRITQPSKPEIPASPKPAEPASPKAPAPSAPAQAAGIKAGGFAVIPDTEEI